MKKLSIVESHKEALATIDKVKCENELLDKLNKEASERIQSLEDSQKKLSELIESLQAEIDNLKSEKESAESQSKELCDKIAELETVSKDVSERTAQAVALIGVSALEVSDETVSEPTREDILKKYNSIQNPRDKAAFYVTNRKNILG